MIRKEVKGKCQGMLNKPSFDLSMCMEDGTHHSHREFWKRNWLWGCQGKEGGPYVL